MNLVDVFVLFVALLAALRGWRRGLIGQFFELGGGFVGLLAGVWLGPEVAKRFTDQPGLRAALISLAVVFVLLSIGQTVGYVVGHRFGKAARSVRLGELDSGLGSAFGIVIWLISFWLIGSLLIGGPSRDLARALRHSASLRITNQVMPEPPNVLAYLQQYLDTSGFPQVFAGLPRTVSPPVDLPTGGQARRAVRAAQDSTVRVVVPACGGVQLGSGWISSEGTVVTNAHVVAGGDEMRIQEVGAAEIPGRVVLFDPDMDLAVIHAPGLTGPPLQLETDRQERGTPGATLGFPGDRGGEFVWKRAAVQASYQATGRDIYGRSRVTRDVYELRAPVRQGDSGGPFVLPSGEVAGVVFAASTTDGQTGYALTAAQVAGPVEAASTRTDPVSTGSCTR